MSVLSRTSPSKLRRWLTGPRISPRHVAVAELAATEFQPLVVQTLVENALKHGVEPKVGPATIALGARVDRGMLAITVAVDGIGITMTKSVSGVGLRNTRDRLRALYGDQARLELAPNTPCGVVATVRVPMKSTS